MCVAATGLAGCKPSYVVAIFLFYWINFIRLLAAMSKNIVRINKCPYTLFKKQQVVTSITGYCIYKYCTICNLSLEFYSISVHVV